jgi:hypothetical protein
VTHQDPRYPYPGAPSPVAPATATAAVALATGDLGTPPVRLPPSRATSLADYLLEGAEAIALYMFGSASAIRSVYRLSTEVAPEYRPPFFKMETTHSAPAKARFWRGPPRRRPHTNPRNPAPFAHTRERNDRVAARSPLTASSQKEVFWMVVQYLPNSATPDNSWDRPPQPAIVRRITEAKRRRAKAVDGARRILGRRTSVLTIASSFVCGSFMSSTTYTARPER